jgi:hypothetical protein
MSDNATLTSGKPSGLSAGKSPSSNPDPRRYRALYPDKWQAFLHAHFRDAVHVAYFFGVSERTGRDWWEGVTASQGWAVAYAIEAIPTAAAYLRAA